MVNYNNGNQINTSINEGYSDISVESIVENSKQCQNDALQMVMWLFMVQLENGLYRDQIAGLVNYLPESKEFIPIEFHANNTSAYGFVERVFFEGLNYQTENLERIVNLILNDINLENSNGLYKIDNNRQYMIRNV